MRCLLSFVVFTRRLFLGLVTIVVGRAINYLCSNLDESMILFRLGRLYSERLFLVVRCVISINAARTVSALQVVARNASARFFLARLRRSERLRVINVLVLVRRSVVRPTNVLLSSFLIVSRGLRDGRRRVVGIRHVHLATALRVDCVGLSSSERLNAFILLRSNEITVMNFNDCRIILHRQGANVGDDELVYLIVRSRLLSSYLRR